MRLGGLIFKFCLIVAEDKGFAGKSRDGKRVGVIAAVGVMDDNGTLGETGVAVGSTLIGLVGEGDAVGAIVTVGDGVKSRVGEGMTVGVGKA